MRFKIKKTDIPFIYTQFEGSKPVTNNFFKMICAAVNSTQLNYQSTERESYDVEMFFSNLKGSLEEKVNTLHERLYTKSGDKITKYEKFLENFKKEIELIHQDQAFLNAILKTFCISYMPSLISQIAPGTKLWSFGEESLLKVTTDLLTIIACIENNKIFGDTKTVSRTLTRIENYDFSSSPNFYRFIKNYFYGGKHTPFANELLIIIDNHPILFSEFNNNNSQSEKSVVDPEDYPSNRPIQNHKLDIMHVDDLILFFNNWNKLSVADKNKLFLKVIKDIHEYESVDSNDNFNPEQYLSALPQLASKFDNYYQLLKRIQVLPEDQKRTKMAILINKIEKDPLFETLFNDILSFNFSDRNIPQVKQSEPINTTKNHKQILHSIIDENLPTPYGRSKSILNIEFQKAIKWAKDLMLDENGAKQGAMTLEQLLAKEINNLDDSIDVKNLYQLLVLNAIMHAGAEYHPTTALSGGGKKSKSETFEYYFINFLKEEYKYYNIPESMQLLFNEFTDAFINDAVFRDIRTRADIYRREMAMPYMMHKKGYAEESELKENQIQDMAEDIYDFLYANNNSNFSIVKDTDPINRGIPVQIADKNEIINIIKSEIHKRNREISNAISNNPNLSPAEVPLNWKNIMAKLSDHEDKFHTRRIKKSEIEIPYLIKNSYINLEKNTDTVDKIYYQWLTRTGLI